MTVSDMDLKIINAKIHDMDGVFTIYIKDGKFYDIVSENHQNSYTAKNTIDAKNKLISPPFVEPHIHLDKTRVKSFTKENMSGTLTEAIEILWDYKSQYTPKEIENRSSSVIEQAIKNGTLYMRSHVDVDSIGKMIPFEGVNLLKQKYKDIIDLQIVTFPQEGIYKDLDTKKYMEQCMANGADIVGGMPANENSVEDSRRHVKYCFDLAKEYNAPIDMHVDETDDPFYRTLEMIADETIKNNYHGRVTCGHTCALAAYDDHYAQYVMDKVRDANINIITNPCTNLVLQGRKDKMPIRRGLTRVKELLERNVNVSCAQDCVDDTFYPFGNANMLSVALICGHAVQMTMPNEIEILYKMITNNSAKIMELDDYGIKVGNSANLIIIDAKTPKEAISLVPNINYVIRNGNIISQSIQQNILNI